MGFIFGLILIIGICYRIYLIGKKIIEIVKKPQFWLASVFLFFYLKISFYILGLPFEMALNINKYNGFGLIDLIAIIMALGIIAGLCYVYYKVSKKFPSVMLPVYALLLIVSLGLIAYKVYNLSGLGVNERNNHKEFVNPHHVDGYTKADGTQVSDYWRDGDNNPNTTLTKEDGGGYFRS